MLASQVNQTLKTRFSMAGQDTQQIQAMLTECYKAEVARRNMKFVDDKETRDRIARAAKWLTGQHKPGLIMYGATCGTGKTTLASAITNLINILYDTPYSVQRKKVYRTTAMDLIKTYADNPAHYRNLVSNELLFIDDLGSEPTSVKIYGNECSPVTELLYARYDHMGWTLITSNLTDEQIKQRYGVRIDDRLSEMAERMYFKGTSYRK